MPSISSSLVSNFPRRHPIWTAVIVILLLFALLFDWNWFRHPVEKYIAAKTQRAFRISSLHVRLGLTPTIRMQDVYFGNASWSHEAAMAQIKTLEFSVSLRDMFAGSILIPRVALTDPDLLFERLPDGRKNWTLSAPTDRSPSKLRISTLSVNKGHLHYVDHGKPFDLDILANTFDSTAHVQAQRSDTKPENNRYTTRYAFNGTYHDAKFSGNALTGNVLSFQESGVLVPLKGDLAAGTTKLEIEGAIADAASITAINVDLHIAGQTMANLYPFLLLPLPASPPYDLRGHLQLNGNRYSMDDLVGKIGSTDINGKGFYLRREPRPLLTADLHSRLLNIADLGPLIGVQTKTSGGKPVIKQAETSNRPEAKHLEQVTEGEHILPAGSFESSRLRAIDADVDLDAKLLKVPTSLPLESLRASLHLHDSVMKLTPLEFGFGGGTITSQITLDARQPVIQSDAQIDLRRVRIDQLLPQAPNIAKSAGLLAATLHIKGNGNSIADAAAKSNGTLSAAIANGRISNLLDAASSLNGGKVLRLLVSGDQQIAIRCGGVIFDVQNGIGKSRLFVIDTDQTQILGSGGFDLGSEQLNMVISPRPKKVGIFSLRTPLRLYGSFRHPQYQLEKGPLALRAGGALALAAVAPFAALVPLIESGPGDNTDCSKVLAPFGTQASR